MISDASTQTSGSPLLVHTSQTRQPTPLAFRYHPNAYALVGILAVVGVIVVDVAILSMHHIPTAVAVFVGLEVPVAIVAGFLYGYAADDRVVHLYVAVVAFFANIAMAVVASWVILVVLYAPGR